MDNIYWAAQQNVDDVAAEVWKKIDGYFTAMKASGRMAKAIRAINTYYGRGPSGGQDTAYLSPGGDGELVNMNTNHFAGLLTQAEVLTTSERPAFKAIAVSTGYGDKAQAQVAEGILEHYDRTLSLHQIDRKVAKWSLLCGEAYGSWSWDSSLGDSIGDPETGEVVSDGDAVASAHTIFDVAFDSTVGDFDKTPWVCIRSRASKWDLAEIFPEKRTEIHAVTSDKSATEHSFDSLDPSGQDRSKEDFVDVWEFRHRSTPALQGGRLIRLISPKCVLYDSHTSVDGEAKPGAYPYGKSLMVRRMTPEQVIGQSAGHTAFFDLLAQQEGIDLVATIMASTVNTSGASNLYVQRGANIQIDSLAGGFNLIQGDVVDAPKPVLSASVSKEALEFAQMCVQWMRQRTAINDVVMGEPTKGMPAQAMALLHAQALQFHSGTAESYQHFTEGMRTDLIDLLKMFANTQRVALVAGAAGKWQLAEYSKKDLAGVSRVYVEQVPAAAKSYAGKVSMAKDLLDMGMIREPQTYIDLISTGQIKPMYEAEEANLMRIQAEMDLLRKGIGLCPVDAMGNFVDDGQEHVRPLITDTHWLDIPQYTGVINTPDARSDPKVVKAVSEVIQYKLKLWRQMDPALIVIMKGVAPPPLMDPSMLGPTSDMTQPPSGGSQSSSAKPEADLGGLNERNGGRGPSMPAPPKNPLTNEKQNPPSDLG